MTDHVDQLVKTSHDARRAGDIVRAESSAREAIAADENSADAWCALAAACIETGALGTALESLNRAENISEDCEGLHNLKGTVFWMQGDLVNAQTSYLKAVESDPDPSKPLFNLALVHRSKGETAAAIDALRKAIAIDPTADDRYALLGEVLSEAVRLEESVEAFDAEIIRCESSAQAWNGRGSALLAQGRQREALESFERAILLDPDNYAAQGNRLMALQYDPDISPQTLFDMHRIYGSTLSRRASQKIIEIELSKEKRNRIRIGYVSGDFNHHSVAFFAEPVVEGHDRDRFEVYLYYTSGRNDEFTARFRHLAEHFHDVDYLDDSSFSARIRADGIDVLVDLSGHTGGSRLPALARRPAPVQVTYLGYPSSTGLTFVDFRITDARSDPPGFESVSSETLVRMPDSYFCFRPSNSSPNPSPPPCARNGFVTFGSFNNLPKLNVHLLETWRRILDALPGSRLLLKNRSLKDEGTRKAFSLRVEKAGIPNDRVELREPHADTRNHLATYREIDIALDTFPYNGATTTCEALWMGVPVVSFAGTRSASRMGASILGAIKLENLITNSADEYVNTAIALARDPSRLSSLHATLREQMKSSPLMDEKTFVTELEARYLRMIEISKKSST